jgi:hypothetical protein
MSGAKNVTFPHGGIGLFTRRAILRVGMLLRDSEIAEVRTQLLNIEKKVTVEQTIANINEVYYQAIKLMIFDNNGELVSDGYRIWKANDFKTCEQQVLNLTTNRGSFDVNSVMEISGEFSPRVIGLFLRLNDLRAFD